MNGKVNAQVNLPIKNWVHKENPECMAGFFSYTPFKIDLRLIDILTIVILTIFLFLYMLSWKNTRLSLWLVFDLLAPQHLFYQSLVYLITDTTADLRDEEWCQWWEEKIWCNDKNDEWISNIWDYQKVERFQQNKQSQNNQFKD